MSSEDGEKSVPPVKGRSKLLLIIGLIVGLIAGGGGAAAYFLLLKPGQVPVAAKPAAKIPEAATYVKIDRLSAPLLSDDHVVGYMLIDLSLELKSKSDELRVVQKLPALRAAFLRAVTETPISKPGQPLIVDFDGLTARLKTVANQELGKSTVSRVLVVQTTRI